MKRKHFICAFMALLSCFVFSANAQVAKIGEQTYTTLADALTAARDGETVSLLWKEGQAPIAMNGSVFGKNVTIKGTANVDWSKGFLFVGRGGEGNATVTFDGANLTSASNSASYGIHVSGREKNTNNKYDGTLVIKNSTIELDYLINKGAMTIDKATLTVKNGFATGGRPATETESGEDATATISLTNESKLVVNNHNGMGLGYEAIGVMNIDATSAFETTQSFLVTAKGTMNIAGKAIVTGTLTNQGAINLTSENATLKAQEGLTVNSTIDGRDVIYADGYYTVKNDPTTLYIANLGDLKAFRDAVNSGKNYYKGVTVYLTADIDMSGENWVGIGTTAADHGFMGNFDGQGYKIKNLTITNPALDSDGYAYAGLFGVTEGTDKDNQNTIKNLTIENVTITTTGHIASAAIAYPYYTIVDKVKVCGDIKIQGGNYTAGVLAYTRRCVNASNLSIVGNEGSFVKGNQTIGGVISDIQMNGGLTAVYSNFSAEGITVTGEKSVGGIAGIIATQTLNGATVKNVTLNSTDDFAGVVAGRLGGTSTISNVVSESVTGATAVIGATYDGAKAVEARIGNMYYATFADAYAAAKAGETVSMLADLNMSEILVLDKDFILDGNGKKLTSTAGRAINVSGADGVTIKNLTINASGERAINIIQNATNVTIDNVTATAANYTVNVAATAANAVVAIKGSNLTGLNVVNVAAPQANVTINGGTITCNDQTEKEGYAALALNKDAVGAKIAATGVTFDIKGDSKMAKNGAEGGEITIDGSTDGVAVNVAYIKSESDYYYAYTSIEAAIEAAKAGETIVLIRDVTASDIITINKAITLDGNGKKLTSTAGRAINVNGADGVTIKNLTINASGERAINIIQNATNVTIDNVTATAANYTVNVAASAPNAKVAISGSTLNGLCTVNVSAAGAQVTVDNSTVNCNDNNTTAGESYAALCLNKAAVGASIVATNTTVNVTEGSDSEKGRNGAENGTVTINGSTEGVTVTVAVITYPGSDNYHGFTSLADAIEFAKAGNTITLIRDVTASAQININKNVTINGNGKTLTSTAARGFQITGGTVAISNLTIDMPNAAEGNRGVNLYNGDTNAALDVTLNNVTINGGKAYAVNIGGGKDNKLTIKNSTLTGYAAINVHTSSVNHTIVVDGSTLNGKNHNNNYSFGTVVIDGTNAHSLTITNTTITTENLEGVTSKYEKVVVGANCTLNWDGEAAVRNILAESKGGKLYYTDLQTAINDAAEVSGTVQILGNITTTKSVVVPANKKVTLDLNGKTISQEKECTASYEMINNKGNLTITGNGKLSFKDTSAGDPNFGWGSYTVRNEGTLVVENGTIEHLGAQAFGKHCIMALYQYSGSTTINGGTISTPNYRSARLWKGDMTINGGTFDGQVWVQAVDNTAKLTINGGTFEPNGGDASAVFVTNNQYDVQFAVTDGTFNGKVGCSDATKLAGAITGGKFNEAAKNGTNAALLATGFIFGEAGTDGYYEVKDDPSTLYIANLNDLKAFRDAVNNGTNYYAGVNVYLAADIDMTGENWVGIGTATKDHGFMGNFDGQGYKIKNLTITNPTLDSDGYAYAGLFGVTEGTDKDNQNTIKNLTIENVTITTIGHIASAAIAYPYYTIVDNVKVCGDIKIQGGNYTAGVLAYTRRCVNASNLSIVGNEGSFVKGNQTVGGVISDIQMNGGLTAVYKNFSAEGLTISGTKQVGGISGIIATQTLVGASVKNVALSCSDARVGIVAGCLGGTSTISNVTYENVTGATVLIGASYDNAKAVQAKIGDTYYATLAEAIAAAEAGETVTMLEDVTLDDALVVEEGMDVTVNGEGKTITGCDGKDVFYVKGGKLTLTEGLNVHATTDCAIYLRGGDVFTAANLTKSGDKYSVIQGNGNYAGNVTITGGKVEASDKQTAIYWPQNGKLTITGGEITGHSAVYIASGSLEITGGKLNGIGANGSYEGVTGGSTNAPGEALTIENVGGNSGYEEISSVVISGGEFFSKNAKAVGSYANTTQNPEAKPVAGFISGGTFSSAVDASYCAEGYIPTQNEDGYYEVVPGTYVAKNGDKYYVTLEEALDADGNEVELLVPYVVAAGETKTLDLKGKTVTMVYAQDATANHTMINNLGDLTIKSSVEGGKLSYTYTGKNLGTTYAANTITSEPGSVLTVKSGTIENLTFDSGVIAYAIDGRTNGGAGDVTVNIEGGVITSKRQAVRIFANSTTNTGALNISGGDFTGRVIVQNASAKANKAALDITGGTFNANEYKSDVLYVGGSSSAEIDINATVSGGTFKGEITETNVKGFISGGKFVMDVTEFCVFGYKAEQSGEFYEVIALTQLEEYTIVDGELTKFVNANVIKVGTLTYQRTLPNVMKWNPLYVPFAIPMSELIDNYDVAYFNDVRGNDANGDQVLDDGTLKMELVQITNPNVILNANYPFVFRAKTEDAKALELVLHDVELCESKERSVVFTSLDIKCEVKGSYTRCQTGDKQYIVNTNGVWSPLDKKYYLNPYRLILTLSSNDQLKPFGARDIRMFVIGEEDEDGTTHIFDVENEAQTQDCIYDLQGRRVLAPQKGGLYIVNGKKTIIK